MVVTQQFRTISSSRQLLRPVSSRPSPSLAARAAWPASVTLQPLVIPPARESRPRPIRRRALHHPVRLAGRAQWFQRRLTVPYWIIALTLASLLAGSLSLARALHPLPADQSVTVPMPFTTTAPTIASAVGSSAERSALTAGTATTRAGDPAQQLEDLRGALAAITVDLERAQRTNALLRDESKRNAAALASARDTLSLSQQNQQGLMQDSQAQSQAQLQDMQARYDALANDVQGRLSALEQKVAAAEQTAARLRGALGLAQVATVAAGGPPVTSATGDPVQGAQAELASLDSRLDALGGTLATVSDKLQSNAAQLRAAGLPMTGDPAADAAFLRLAPLGFPVNGARSSAFGYRQDPFTGTTQQFHTGIDLSVPEGTRVTATGGGIVRIAGWYGGYGNLVMIDHGRGVSSFYGHNAQVLVKVGQRVSAGDLVALSGNTGYSTGPHVHYELRLNDVPFDPQPLANLAH